MSTLEEMREPVESARSNHYGLGAWLTLIAIGIVIALALGSVAYMNSTPAAASPSTFPATIARVYNFSGLCGETLLINGSYFKTGNRVCHNIPRFTCTCDLDSAASIYGPLAASIPAFLAPKRVTSSVSDVTITYGQPAVTIVLMVSSEGTAFFNGVIFVNQTSTTQYIIVGTVVNAGAEGPVTCGDGEIFGPAAGFQFCYEAEATADAQLLSVGSALLLAGGIIVATVM